MADSQKCMERLVKAFTTTTNNTTTNSSISSNHSNEFSETRLAQILETEERRIDQALLREEYSVSVDDRNCFAWNVFVRARRRTTVSISSSQSIEEGEEKEKASGVIINNDTAATSSTTTITTTKTGGGNDDDDDDDDDHDRTTDQWISSVEFRLHPTFNPHIIKQRRAPFEVQRVGWGEFCVEVIVELKQQQQQKQKDVVLFGDNDDNDDDRGENNNILLEFDHDLDFSVSKVSNVYHYYENNNNNGTLVEIEIGSTHYCVANNDEESSIVQNTPHLLRLVKERKLRRRILYHTKERHEKLQNANSKLSTFLQRIPTERHNMALGAYLAGVYRGSLSIPYLQDLYDFATDNLRYIILDEETLSKGWRDYVIHWRRYLSHGNEQDIKYAFTLSKPLSKMEQIDIFVSHCWSDDGTTKADSLEEISRDFFSRRGRLPRFWLDIFCMPQTGSKTIEKNVAALPLFLKACETMVVLLSHQLLSRLWCLVEIYTGYILSPRNGKVKIHLFPVEEDMGKTISSPKNIVWIEEARCGLKSDQDLLLRNLEEAPGGIAEVERGVNVALKFAVDWTKAP